MILARVIARRVPLLLGVLCAAAGCGPPAGNGAGSFKRLELALPPGPVPVFEEQRLALFEPAAEPESWEIRAPTWSVRPLPGAGAGLPGAAAGPADGVPQVLVVNASSNDDELSLRRKGTFPLDRVNLVRVTMTYAGGNFGFMRASLWRGEEQVVQSVEQGIPESASPGVFSFELPSAAGDGVCDTLELSVRGRLRRPGFLSVELAHVPLGGFVPRPGGPAELIVVGSEGRRGTGLVSGHPLGASVLVPPGGRLSFSYAQTPALRKLSVDPVLSVIVGPDGDQRTERFRATSWDRWWSGEIPLGRWAGRRVPIRFAAEARAGDTAWMLAEPAVWSPADHPPTVLLVTSDTHRADHLGAAPHGVGVDTPALDALAARGVLFEDCFAPTNVTNPSHIALMTGVHPRDLGISQNRQPLADAARTLAEVYREAGYLTQAVISTRHLGHVGSGLGQGFDRMSWPDKAPRKAAQTLDLVDGYLADAGSRPLFLWVHVFDAHVPYDAPGEFVARYYDTARDPFDPALPDPGLTPGQVPVGMPGLRDPGFARAEYKAEVTYLDSQLARLLDTGRFASAVVAVVGDHGEGLGQGHVFFGHDELYPETVRVPLLLSWPGAPAGARVPDPVSHLDLARTLLDLSGLAAVPFPGRSLTRLLPVAERVGEPRFLLSSGRLSASLEFRDHYLLLWLADDAPPVADRSWEKHQVELYDLSADPDCRHDLAAERPAVTRAMRARLVAWLQAAEPKGWSTTTLTDPTILEQLEQLGYVHTEITNTPLWEEDGCPWCLRYASKQ